MTKWSCLWWWKRDRNQTLFDATHHISDDNEGSSSYYASDHRRWSNRAPPIKITDPTLRSLAKDVKTVQASHTSSPGPSRCMARKQKQLTLFSAEALYAATNGYSTIIGRGGYGPVYKGYWNNRTELLAVKTLKTGGCQGNDEFVSESVLLAHLQHPNLVTLIGICCEFDNRILVYEFVPNGNLATHISEGGKALKLNWRIRMNIAAGVARGLWFVHKKKVIIRDLKTENILLDDGFNPKISDFGLAIKTGPTLEHVPINTHGSPAGTLGYCAPEYADSGVLTYKADVYSFGVVLLELITGRSALYYKRNKGPFSLVKWVRGRLAANEDLMNMIDPFMKGKSNITMSSLKKALSIATLCTSEATIDRPSMAQVVDSLHKVLTSLDEPQSPGTEAEASTSAQPQARVLTLARGKAPSSAQPQAQAQAETVVEAPAETVVVAVESSEASSSKKGKEDKGKGVMVDESWGKGSSSASSSD